MFAGALRGLGRRLAQPGVLALGAGTAACWVATSSDSWQLPGGSTVVARSAAAPHAAWERPVASGALPTYSLAEVAKHVTVELGVWVTFRGGVYDITPFIANHPGGVDKIMTAAGQSVEPFWSLYRQHLQPAGSGDGGPVPKEHVAEILAPLQVGWLDPAEMAKAPAGRDADDPYAREPARHPALRMLSETPCSGESPSQLMADSWTTPNALFFVRNHHPVPVLSEETFTLEVIAPDGSWLPLIAYDCL